MRRFLILFLCLCCLEPMLFAQNKKAPKRSLSSVENELALTRDSLRVAVSRQDSLIMQLMQLDTVRTLFGNELLDKFKEYPFVSFKEMNRFTIDSLLFLGNRIASSSLKPFLSALDSASSRYMVYQKGLNVLENDCDTVAIRSSLSLIDSIIPDCPVVQRDELLSLADRLGLYRRALSRTKRIAVWVEEALSIYRNDEDSAAENARGAAEFIFSDRDYDYQEYISKIPYLDSLYRAYMKTILESPLTVGPEERQILSYDN